MSFQRKAITRAKLARQTIANEFGELRVMRKSRSVRITAITRQEAFTGRPSAASYAFVDLDEAGVDWLIRRLTAIRGGRRAIWRPRRRAA